MVYIRGRLVAKYTSIVYNSISRLVSLVWVVYTIGRLVSLVLIHIAPPPQRGSLGA